MTLYNSTMLTALKKGWNWNVGSSNFSYNRHRFIVAYCSLHRVCLFT